MRAARHDLEKTAAETYTYGRRRAHDVRSALGDHDDRRHRGPAPGRCSRAQGISPSRSRSCPPPTRAVDTRSSGPDGRLEVREPPTTTRPPPTAPSSRQPSITAARWPLSIGRPATPSSGQRLVDRGGAHHPLQHGRRPGSSRCGGGVGLAALGWAASDDVVTTQHRCRVTIDRRLAAQGPEPVEITYVLVHHAELEIVDRTVAEWSSEERAATANAPSSPRASEVRTFESLRSMAGRPFVLTFGTPGTYAYFCSIHPDRMSGDRRCVAPPADRLSELSAARRVDRSADFGALVALAALPAPAAERAHWRPTVSRPGDRGVGPLGVTGVEEGRGSAGQGAG